MRSWIRAFLLALITLPLIYGIGRNVGSFLQPFETLLNITRVESSTLLSVRDLATAVGLLLFGQLTQFLPLNRVLLIGMLVSSLGFFMSSFAKSYSDLILWFSIINGLGFGVALLCCFSTSIYDVYEKRGVSTGVNSAFQVGGGAVFLVGLRWLIDNVFGLSVTFEVLAILTASGGICGYFLASKEVSSHVWFKFDKRLIWFYLSTSIVMGITMMGQKHRLPIFKEAGLGVGSLGILGIVMLISNAGTEPLAGWFFIDKLKRSRLGWILSSIGTVSRNIFLIALAIGFITFPLYALLIGIVFLLPVPLVPAMNYLADTHKKDFSPLMGTTLFFVNISAALFTWLAGAFYTHFGDYKIVFLGTAAIALLAAFLVKKK